MNAKTYLEPQTVLPVYDECDVLVVGGGAAGHSAADLGDRPIGD